MQLHSTSSELRRLAFSTFGIAALASAASAQVTFSVDWHSPTVGMPDSCTGVPMTEGDILSPAGVVPMFGPLPPPCIAVSGGAGGLGLAFHATCVGHAGGTPCRVEVDALSYGTDVPLGPNTVAFEEFAFSTDEYAIAGVPPVLFPSITSEAPFGDSSTDIWRQGAPMPPGPLPPFAAPVGHIGLIDGDGMVSGSGAAYPGTGLIEPNFPGFPNTGDNLDAMDINQSSGVTPPFPASGVYFSLDAAFGDPYGTPNTGSALGHGFTGGDILKSAAPGGPPMLWAPGPALGLNLINMQEDDLDALAIWDNGNGVFDPSQTPYDWTGGGTDMVLFSVRRGSPVIGMPDSFFGIPISEGDILTTPLPTAFGGVSPFPAIFCAAENIGLMARVAGAPSDDLNALDTIKTQPPITDCNGNGIDDSIDIMSGTSTDVNTNGVPDECEVVGTPGCFCFSAIAPCGNAFPTAGCLNSTGTGALLTVGGTSSVANDDLILSTSGMPSTVPALYFGGTLAVGPFPFGDGLRCVGGNIIRFGTPSFTTAAGTLSIGPGLAGTFGLLPFSTWNIQCWFRDPTGPCGSGFNTSNSYAVTFTP